MGFSVDSTLKALLDDERARAVLQKHFAGRGEDSRIHTVMYETLRSIATYPEAGISQATLQAVDEELRAL